MTSGPTSTGPWRPGTPAQSEQVAAFFQALLAAPDVGDSYTLAGRAAPSSLPGDTASQLAAWGYSDTESVPVSGSEFFRIQPAARGIGQAGSIEDAVRLALFAGIDAAAVRNALSSIGMPANAVERLVPKDVEYGVQPAESPLSLGAGMGRTVEGVIVAIPEWGFEGDAVVTGTVYGFGSGTTPVIFVPTVNAGDLAASGVDAFEQGQTVQVAWTKQFRNSQGQIMPRPADSQQELIEARVVFADVDETTTFDTLKEILGEQGLRYDDETMAQLEAAGIKVADVSTDFGKQYEIALATADLMDDTRPLWRQQEPVRMVYDRNGNQIRSLAWNETDVQVGDVIDGKVVGQIFNEQGEPAGPVAEIEPYFDRDMVDEFVLRYRGDPVRMNDLIEAAVRSGLMPRNANRFGVSQDLINAVTIAMAYSNTNGIMDNRQTTDPFDAVMLAMNSFSANRRRLAQPFDPPTSWLPSQDSLEASVISYFESQTGRRPTSVEMRDLVDFLDTKYRMAMEQVNEDARQEYLIGVAGEVQTDPDTGMPYRTYHLTRDQEEALVKPARDEVRQISPEASLQRYIDNKYGRVTRFMQDKEAIPDLRASVLGAMSTSERLMERG